MSEDSDSTLMSQKHVLQAWYSENPQIFEIGSDEVGRGPLFGRVYAGAAVLPKCNSFNHLLMKDSKRFHSNTKIIEAYEYIKENAVAYAVKWEDEKVIDNINILQATQSAMRKAILDVKTQLYDQHLCPAGHDNILLLIDGDYFNPIMCIDQMTNKLSKISHRCIRGGDDKYTAIAAASILAKVERDQYIDDLCAEHPSLAEHYSIDKNKGYGAAVHMDGIKKHGITQWHRRSFGICKSFV